MMQWIERKSLVEWRLVDWVVICSVRLSRVAVFLLRLLVVVLF